jgi:hypothetical protein
MAALGVSGAFLPSYLIYRYHVGNVGFAGGALVLWISDSCRRG